MWTSGLLFLPRTRNTNLRGKISSWKVQEEAGQLEVDFCSITIDGGGTSDDILQRRLHSISRQREDLEQMEIDLRAQIVARSEIMKVQKDFDAQIKEHANAAAELKVLSCICLLIFL